jgi:hypothetical protein
MLERITLFPGTLNGPSAMNLMDENLVGYLLDALDPTARREVEAYLRSSPQAREQLVRLRRILVPLESDRDIENPPADLVDRTVARFDRATPASLPTAPQLSRRQAAPRGWWRRADVLVASLLGIVLVGMVGGWLATTRNTADLTACQDNLRRFHAALMSFANQREDGAFPRVEPQGPRAFAGVFMVTLADARVMPADVSLCCPAQGTRPATTLSHNLDSLARCYNEDRARFEEAVTDLVGCYAYSLGFREGHGLRGLKPASGMDHLPIMSDCPPFSGKGPESGGNSHAHRGQGQNVLFIDGSVRYMTSRQLKAGDDIYLNNDRRILAGVHEGDSVLAASDAAP